MAVYQTIHHPPEGESLGGSRHLTSSECLCKPELTTTHERRVRDQGYVVVAHYWHHKFPEEKNSEAAVPEAGSSAEKIRALTLADFQTLDDAVIEALDTCFGEEFEERLREIHPKIRGIVETLHKEKNS